MSGAPDAILTEKRSIRQCVKERRQAWLASTTPEERTACIASIWSQVESSEAFRSARTILLYASLPDEVPTDTVLQRWSQLVVPDAAIASGSSSSDSAFSVRPDLIGHPSASKTLVLPLVEGECLRLKAYDPAALRPGYQGIPEPLPSCPDVTPETIDLAIIPGRAFTPDGWRLGRGKGFYDRLLPTLAHARKIGVAYPYQILESLPLDPWDVPLDAVYTSFK